jgi:hypothetical protein
MLKLVLYLAGENPKVHEVAFKVSDAPNPQLDSNLYYRDGDLRKSFREFMQVKESDAPRENPAEPAATPERTDRERARKSRDRKPSDVPGLEDAAREGEDQAVIADPKLKIPFYYPTKRVAGSVYSGTEPRIYKLKDERGKRREAYRLVLSTQRVGEYYGVQGLAWKAPPILDDPDRTIRRGNRKFRLYYDGKRLRLVAWRTKRGVYWISNTLTQSIEEDQMIAIASSLKRLKQ